VVKEPFEKAFSMSNIKAGFSKAGIYPLNSNAIDSAKIKPSEFYIFPSSSGGSSAETSSVLASATLSPLVSSVDCSSLTTPCSSSSYRANRCSKYSKILTCGHVYQCD